jgi:hypothetical protein
MDGALGTFPASTGLFDWEADEDVLRGDKPFEIRIRREPTSTLELKHKSRTEWRDVIYGAAR